MMTLSALLYTAALLAFSNAQDIDEGAPLLRNRRLQWEQQQQQQQQQFYAPQQQQQFYSPQQQQQQQQNVMNPQDQFMPQVPQQQYQPQQQGFASQMYQQQLQQQPSSETASMNMNAGMSSQHQQPPPPQQQPQQPISQQLQPALDGSMPYALPASAAEWCSPSILPPLPYEECPKKDQLNSVPLYGGLTNSLKIVLLGAILSFEEGRCLVVDESDSELIMRKDPSQSLSSFISRYFEPIGLDVNSNAFVKSAKSQDKVKVRDWSEVWSDYDHNRRTYGHLSDIEWLKYHKMEGHQLKRTMMRRMWRPLPHVRDNTCKALANHGLQEEFITFSIRQGDKKSEENFEFATMQQYIDEAERSIPVHFGGVTPKIFVATDDCSVLAELRGLRPDWTFVSQCDVHSEEGFALKDVKDWSLQMTDDHFGKFFTELFAMATAKVFIGIWYTNVTWWAFFMRGNDRTTFKLLDTPGVEDRESLDWW